MSNTRRVDNSKPPSRRAGKRVKDIPVGAMHTKTSRLGFRASESQVKIIRMASDISHKSLTDFITDSAFQAAEKVILDQRLFMVSQDVYEKFNEVLDRPAQENQGLKDLFSTELPWESNDIEKTRTSK